MCTSFHEVYETTRRIYRQVDWHVLTPSEQTRALYETMRQLDAEATRQRRVRARPRTVRAAMLEAA